MEFEELQKIWLDERQQSVYVIDEKALQHHILSKKRRTLHIANATELLLLVVNFCAGGFVFGMTFWGSKSYAVLYVMAAWMCITALYVLISRIRRLKEQPPFDRSLREDLQHAIATAAYQVRLSQLMRLNVLPIAALSLLGMWNSSKPVWATIGIALFFVLTWYLSGWEHRLYKNKKRTLETLQDKLEKDRMV